MEAGRVVLAGQNCYIVNSRKWRGEIKSEV